ncbi:MAG: DNA-3-methyladenine glycosylase [Cyanobacteria bacterium]|nr:DNA-3-methyladenine glycosylase [Cyanobacteriota bacterium]MDW8200379.1 DNA-3-methyladenine glycosylase [Cyanobacteriota bacterium SKYGB_h_bin112]
MGEPIVAAWLSRSSLDVAPELIGCTLVRRFASGEELRGMIVETEAYTVNDPACHAYRRRTARNQVMFGPAGFSYIYKIYGMYHCFNVVTDGDGIPSAVLIRALQVDHSLSTAVAHIQHQSPDKPHRVAAGPGKLCRWMQIDTSLSSTPLVPGSPLWLEQRSPAIQQAFDDGTHTLVQTTRIGISQGTELPWRWYLNESPAVSRR